MTVSLSPAGERVGERVGERGDTVINPHCPVHPDLEAAATCARCGTFVCATCLPVGAQICAACTKRLEAEPLDAAIHWAVQRVSALRLAVGVTSTLIGVSLSLSFVFFILGGIVGGTIAAGLAVIVIALGRVVSALLLRVLAPYWITRAKERFALHDEVLQELRLVLR